MANQNVCRSSGEKVNDSTKVKTLMNWSRIIWTCNLQGKLLEELDNSIYRDSSRCKYAEDLDACVDIELHQMITRHNYLSEKAEEKSRILLIIKDSNSILDRLEKMVVELKRVLKLTEKLNKKIYIQRQEEPKIEEQEETELPFIIKLTAA